MGKESMRRYRAGDSVDDLCRACKVMRTHAVMAAGTDGNIVRVVCGYCGSHHNYRGGERAHPLLPSEPRFSEKDDEEGARSLAPGAPGRSDLAVNPASPTPVSRPGPHPTPRDAPLPLVSERERRYPPMSLDDSEGRPIDLESLLRRVLREEMGLGPVALADRWRGGDLVLRPGKPGLQEKVWPIETFFHKVVMLRNRLRVLEQQINGMKVPEDEKVRLQSYITGCYGTLTSFNVLFSSEEDRFRGGGSSSED